MMEISAVSFSRQISVQASRRDHETPREDESEEFKMFINDDEVTDFSSFVEQMLSNNDIHFPEIMDCLILNSLLPEEELSEIYSNIGYKIVSVENVNDRNARWKLIRNLSYLKLNDCDLNLELLNFLRSLTFGGKIINHGDLKSSIQVMKTILPFCTNFFENDKYWNKIRYFCYDTPEVIDALNFLILNYGKEKNYKFLQPLPKNTFSLKHLARNKVRDVIWSTTTVSNSTQKCNVRYYKLCKAELPSVLFTYINFLD